ncbi:unnamed protein product [Echinostoma caproni]|uniref:GRAM domain-containing protein n=1 Tax=Echinostoma caproni TaxID=27848 RepID=A0A183A046_9TREM|nr:unnamed protein product [Echinostoma caproni]
MFLQVPTNCEAFHVFALPSASILIFISGSGRLQIAQPWNVHNDDSEASGTTETSEKAEKKLHNYAGCVNRMIDFDQGMVFFVSADVSFVIHQSCKSVDKQDCKPVLAFRAYTNVEGKPLP